MRAKLVQGTNSMIWANRVLPTFTAAPRGCQSRETTYYLVVRIQIGTKSNWTQTRANACSRACHGGFNRTAVMEHLLSWSAATGKKPTWAKGTYISGNVEPISGNSEP